MLFTLKTVRNWLRAFNCADVGICWRQSFADACVQVHFLGACGFCRLPAPSACDTSPERRQRCVITTLSLSVIMTPLCLDQC